MDYPTPANSVTEHLRTILKQLTKNGTTEKGQKRKKISYSKVQTPAVPMSSRGHTQSSSKGAGSKCTLPPVNILLLAMRDLIILVEEFLGMIIDQ